MEKISLNSDEMIWEKVLNYPEGTMCKVLREDGNKKTILLKIPPYFKMDAHSHTVVEQHFVLEGEYKIGGKVFKKGYYELIPEGFTHGPFYTETGALILVVWDSYK
jgi:anti-sigma factor ChrR (cupin superfamily)